MHNQIIRVIRQYRNNLEALGIRVKKIILYGSYARGEVTRDSDIDLLVVSDDFEGMDLWERQCLLGRARVGIKRPMEILGLTDEELAAETDGTFVAEEIKKGGVEVR